MLYVDEHHRQQTQATLADLVAGTIDQPQTSIETPRGEALRLLLAE
jgi:hypothetical protein